MGTPNELSRELQPLEFRGTIQSRFECGKIHWLGRYACCEGGDNRKYRCPHGYRRMRASQLLRVIDMYGEEFKRHLDLEIEKRCRILLDLCDEDLLPEGFQNSKEYSRAVEEVFDSEIQGWDEAVFGELGYFIEEPV